jgi:DNA repair exonuclease SbcCD ATPase subunit
VELTIDGETYTRTFTRTSDGVTTTGDPFTDDPQLIDLFAFLLESNEARRAVERGDDLHELIMRPVDTDAIDSEVERLRERRDALDAELDAIDAERTRLPDLERERTRLETSLEETRADLERVETEIAETDADLAASRQAESTLQDALDELRDARASLEDARFEADTERETLAELRAERAAIAQELSALSDAPTGGLAEVDADLGRLRSAREALERDLSDLQTVIQFNRDMHAEGGTALLGTAAEDADPTDSLVADDEVTCWTCGTTVADDRIEATLDRLSELRQHKVSEIEDLEGEIETLVAERESLQTQQRNRDALARDLEQTDSEIERREARLAALEDRLEALDSRVERLEATAADDGSAEYADLVDLHRQANHLEFEVDRLQSELGDVEDELSAVEADLGREGDVRADREAVADRLASLRTRVEDVERAAVDSFNDHMETILGVLEYENVERIWIERGQRTVQQGSRLVEQTTFDLHVVRESDSGVYEDTVDNLSESEREVTGLVFALAGFLVHDVHEHVPVVVLDSLEAIDSTRIAALVEYFADYVDFTVVALLPADAQALDDACHSVTELSTEQGDHSTNIGI